MQLLELGKDCITLATTEKIFLIDIKNHKTKNHALAQIKEFQRMVIKTKYRNI